MFPGVRLVFRFADSYEINFCHFSAGLGPVARRPHSADTGHQAAQIRGGNLGAERDADPGLIQPSVSGDTGAVPAELQTALKEVGPPIEDSSTPCRGALSRPAGLSLAAATGICETATVTNLLVNGSAQKLISRREVQRLKRKAADRH
jgi:hypothetical protein